jgi:hypothetical protein
MINKKFIASVKYLERSSYQEIDELFDVVAYSFMQIFNRKFSN